MPEVHDIGSHYFVHAMKYPTKKFPFIDKGNTQEIEWPYRTGDSLVMRFPWSRSSVVLGKWNGKKNETDALTQAIGVRELGVYVPK